MSAKEEAAMEAMEATEATEAKVYKQLKEWNKELRTVLPLMDLIIHDGIIHPKRPQTHDHKTEVSITL